MRPHRKQCAISVALFIALLFLGTACFTACHSTSKLEANTQDTTAAKDSTSVKTPLDDKNPDQSTQTQIVAMMPLSQFPTTDPHLSVALSKDLTRADIKYDGKVIQTIVDEEDGLVSVCDDFLVHYFDANFDGHTDIFLGMGESRTYSTLLICNVETQQFLRIGKLGDPSLQGFMLETKSKSIIEGGSNSYCEFAISRSQWEGNTLVMKEYLTIITDPSQYGIGGFEHRYTLRDTEEKVLCSTENCESLPKMWQSIVKEYGY